MAALADYKTFLQKELLPKATGAFAYGADACVKALSAREAVDLPLDRLLQIAETDRQKNEDAFQRALKQVDPSKPADRVIAALQLDHPQADKLLQTTQDTLDAIRQFITDHHIITIPASDPARVKETPPFMRSTTSASMDTPGPFETAKLQAFYNMTLPDPRKPRAEQDDTCGLSTPRSPTCRFTRCIRPHIQFLYAKNFPSDIRKVFGANTGIEGYNYCGQMMFDRLSRRRTRRRRAVSGRPPPRHPLHRQHQDAHAGMTVDEATKLSKRRRISLVAVPEAARHPMRCGYFTLGKLMILKLRDDHKGNWPQYAAGLSRCVHQTRAAPAADDSESDAGRRRNAVVVDVQTRKASLGRIRIRLRDDAGDATLLDLPRRRMWPFALILAAAFAIFAGIGWTMAGRIAGSAVRDVFDLMFVLFEAFWLLGWSVAVVILGGLTVLFFFYSESARLQGGRLVYVPQIGPFKIIIDYDLARVRNIRLEKADGDDTVRIRFDDDEGSHGLGDAMPRVEAERLVSTIRSAASTAGAALDTAMVAPAPDAPLLSSPTSAPRIPEAPPPSLTSRSGLALIAANLVPLAGVLFFGWDLAGSSCCSGPSAVDWLTQRSRWRLWEGRQRLLRYRSASVTSAASWPATSC